MSPKKIEHDVEASCTSCLRKRFGHVYVSQAQANCGVRAQFGQCGQDVFISSRRDDPSGTEMFRDLDCELTGASGGSKNQNVLTWRQPRRGNQWQPGR